MNFFTIIFIGFRFFLSKSSILFNKLVIIFTITSIAIGVSLIIIIMSIINGFENEFQKNILKFIPHVVVTNKNSYMNSSNFINIEKIFKSVEKISRIIVSEVIVQYNHNFSVGTVFGTNEENDYLFKLYSIKKDIVNQLTNNSFNAIIGQSLADQLNIHIGDNFSLISSDFNQLSIFGRLPTKRIFKLIGVFNINNEVENYHILVNKNDLSNFLHYPSNYITGWRLWLSNPLDINKLSLKHINSNKFNYQIRDWREKKGILFQAINTEKYMMILLFSLIIIISVFSIFTSVSISVIEKEKDIAILKTLGLSKINIITIFVIQGFIFSILGTISGTLLSFLIMNTKYGIFKIIQLYCNNLLIPIKIIPYQLIIINLLSILLVVSSTIYPALKSTNVLPNKRLTNE